MGSISPDVIIFSAISLEDKVNKMESKINFLYDNNSPIYSAVLEDYEQE